jgi:Zn-dependent protease with chaperone function
MRKYQEYRDGARGMTKELCFLLAIAVTGTIVLSALAIASVTVAAAYGYQSALTKIDTSSEHWSEVFLQRFLVAGGLLMFTVIGTAVYRTMQLAEDGGRGVARSLGGTRVLGDAIDPGHVKVLNVVEELAIATSMRTPAVYVLEDEPGINAFAAGTDEKDAAIGVSRGAIDTLKRHQLSGVVAHEFSHIANGDMRLNIRLLGILTGIQSITFVARYLLRLARPTSASKRRVGGKPPLGIALALVFGAVLWPIGQIGSLFAVLIHLGVNRQREFLADASAVQSTRDPQGLCEALVILLESEVGGRMRGPGAQLASYMFFASSGGAWQRLFETHPALQERIRRLDLSLTVDKKRGHHWY